MREFVNLVKVLNDIALIFNKKMGLQFKFGTPSFIFFVVAVQGFEPRTPRI